MLSNVCSGCNNHDLIDDEQGFPETRETVKLFTVTETLEA
jgi:hypothetical protein